MPRSPRPWTPADDQIVRSLPPAEAAERTGRPLARVYARRRALGVHAAKRPWTAAEDRLVMRLPAAAALAYLKRSPPAVELRRLYLGLRTDRWPAEGG